MGQKKLQRFEAIKSFSNVLQYPENMKGNWSHFFGNDHPVTLELACGKGEYSLALGKQHPESNFIGVDLKGNRIYIGAKAALTEGLRNVAFLRTQIGQITEYFAEREVNEIWIIFPDPFLRKSKAKNRLTHPRFLSLYQKILIPTGVLHLKTDSKELYDFTLETLAEQKCSILSNIQDVYGLGKNEGALQIQTFYEKMHLAEGRKIYYLAFRLPDSPIKLPPKNSVHESGEQTRERSI